MRVAIIDMGTNTFNLLVAESLGNNRFQTLHSSKCFVKLGEGGIDKKFIAPEAWERGLNAIETHITTLSKFDVEKVFAFATSATRDAENGVSFVNEIFNKHKLKVSVIKGEEEANLIYLGVRQALDLGDETSLILDIGGGSNELILCNSTQPIWMHSFNLGVQRLLSKFNPSDPIKLTEIETIIQFLEIELKSLLQASVKNPPVRLIGSSGSFDTYRSLLDHQGVIPFTKDCYANIPIAEFELIHHKLLQSTREQRIAMPGMEPIRVDYIVLASIFTNFIIERLGIKSIYQSNYALKEGALWKLMNSLS